MQSERLGRLSRYCFLPKSKINERALHALHSSSGLLELFVPLPLHVSHVPSDSPLPPLRPLACAHGSTGASIA